MGISIVAVPEGARTLARSPERIRRIGIAVSTAASVGTLLWGVIVVLLPSDLGRLLVGVSWDPASPLLLPMAISMAAIAAAIGARSILAALREAGRIAKVRIAGGFIQVGAVAAGAVWDGALGAMRALIVSETLTSTIWWRAAHNVLREPHSQISDSQRRHLSDVSYATRRDPHG